MTEGGIAAWKIKEGDSFSAGDVLLEIVRFRRPACPPSLFLLSIADDEDSLFLFFCRRPTRPPSTLRLRTTECWARSSFVQRVSELKVALASLLADARLGCSFVREQKADGAKGIQVGELIGILVEEGDDMSNLSADQFSSSDSSAPTPASSSSESTSSPPPPQESSPLSSSTAPPAQAHGHGHFSHAKPLAPSVSRLLATSSLTPEQVKNLKGSGRDGYLTKGDVLKAMGKVATVWGTKEAETLEKAGKRGVMERFAVSSLPSTFSHLARALGLFFRDINN